MICNVERLGTFLRLAQGALESSGCVCTHAGSRGVYLRCSFSPGKGVQSGFAKHTAVFINWFRQKETNSS